MNNNVPNDFEQSEIMPPRIMRMHRWIVPSVYVFCGIAFLIDLQRANSFAYGIVYAPMIATGVFHRSRIGTWILAAVASVMVVVGAFFPFVDSDLPDLIANRVLSIMAILATALFVDYARIIQERLAALTRRAEAAERIKTEVFTNLSEEMRTPLHSLIGLMSLLKAGARPDQVEAVERIDTGARQLLISIDNLIDLTQFDERPLMSQAVDMNEVAREAVSEAAGSAKEHAVVIEVAASDLPASGSVSVPSGGALALGDPWAIRRIMDNLISYLIRQSEPGERVSILVRHNGRDIVTSVAGPVAAQSVEAARHTQGKGDEHLLCADGSAGMALSQRLASRMNGRLLVANAANDAAIFRLSLPAA